MVDKFKLITGVNDIHDNILHLDKIRRSERGTEFESYKKLIGQGIDFYSIHIDGFLVFAPSKFIGYKNNRIKYYMDKQLQRERDGRDTTKQINKIDDVGKLEKSNPMHKKYYEFCKIYDIIPAPINKNNRKFWPTSKTALVSNVRDSD